MNPYETQKLVDEYLLFHYGTADEILPWTGGPSDALDFPLRTARYAKKSVSRALDLGCAVGRSSLELSNFAKEIIGIDFSQAFVNAAETIRSGTTISYRRLEEASIFTQLEAALPPDSHPSRVSYEQGDAMNLRADLGQFDIVHAANLLCRLPEPQKLLDRLPDLVAPSGQLILATPCTWLSDYTPPENFPPGSTLDWLKDQLAPSFDLVTEANEPFLIRETARKFQWTMSLLTVWQRRH